MSEVVSFSGATLISRWIKPSLRTFSRSDYIHHADQGLVYLGIPSKLIEIDCEEIEMFRVYLLTHSDDRFFFLYIMCTHTQHTHIYIYILYIYIYTSNVTVMKHQRCALPAISVAYIRAWDSGTSPILQAYGRDSSQLSAQRAVETFTAAHQASGGSWALASKKMTMTGQLNTKSLYNSRLARHNHPHQVQEASKALYLCPLYIALRYSWASMNHYPSLPTSALGQDGLRLDAVCSWVVHLGRLSQAPTTMFEAVFATVLYALARAGDLEGWCP